MAPIATFQTSKLKNFQGKIHLVKMNGVMYYATSRFFTPSSFQNSYEVNQSLTLPIVSMLSRASLSSSQESVMVSFSC